MPVVKKVQDYYEKMFELYPEVAKSDIKRILQYGWKSYYLHNSFGGDVLISRNKFWMYTGMLMKDSLEFFAYYQKKMANKIRIKYKRNRPSFDGYYYFGLTQAQYDNYLSQKNRRGRPKKNFTFSKIVLYKIWDEFNIIEHNVVALFRIPIGVDLGFTLFKEQLVTDKAEFLQERKTLKFHDILLSEYDYQFLKDHSRKNKLKSNE